MKVLNYLNVCVLAELDPYNLFPNVDLIQMVDGQQRGSNSELVDDGHRSEWGAESRGAAKNLCRN